METGVVRAVGVDADPELLSGVELLQPDVRASASASANERFKYLLMLGSSDLKENTILPIGL
ncbi:MAG: hypothetical protein DMG12_05605 [Acidobacteria bacterium]|nr:MAG: hypothetical protein DMG12_05605 [Acidobacteriota bacterium]